MLIEGKKIIEIPEEYRPEIDELPGDLSRIAAEIEQYWPRMGVRMTLFLAQVFRGQPVFFRNIDPLVRRMRDDAIRLEYDRGDSTMLVLASRYNIGHRRIKQILATSGDQGTIDDKQMRLF